MNGEIDALPGTDCHLRDWASRIGEGNFAVLVGVLFVRTLSAVLSCNQY